MGLFARKREEETENRASSPRPDDKAESDHGQTQKADGPTTGSDDAAHGGAEDPEQRRSESTAGPDSPPTKADFDIDRAIELMRALPAGNEDLVATVVTQTLSSLNVDLDKLISSAGERVESTSATIDTRRRKIIELEAEISGHRSAIDSLENELKEVEGVERRLRNAMTSDSSKSSAPTKSNKSRSSEPSNKPSRSKVEQASAL